MKTITKIILMFMNTTILTLSSPKASAMDNIQASSKCNSNISRMQIYDKPTIAQNKISVTSQVSTNTTGTVNLSACNMFNDVYLKESKDSNIYVTLHCVSEGANPNKIKNLLKEINIKIDKENNQYKLNIYRNDENLLISSDEMKDIDYINFDVTIELPSTIKSLSFGNFGSVKFDNLTIDKINISTRGDVIGKNIFSKDCTLYANDSEVQVDKFNCDKLYIRTHNKLKSKEITSKECTLITNRAVVQIDKINCDKLYRN